MDQLQAVNEYALSNDFVAGYPLYRTASDDATTLEVVLIRPQNTKAVCVSLDEFYKPPLVLQSDYRTQADLLNSLFLQADQWGVGKGYKGALPTGLCEIDEVGSMRYEFVALFKAGVARRRMPLANANELRDAPQLTRKVHAWSVKEGYVSGFSTGRFSNKQLDCVLLSADQVEVRHVPIAQLNLGKSTPFNPTSP